MLTHFRRLCRRLPRWPAAVVVIACLDCLLAQSLVLERHALRARSLSGTATVTARPRGRSGLARAFLGPNPAVTYTFDAGGKTYRHTQRVAPLIYEGLPLGSTVCITYLRRDPHTTALAGSITFGSVFWPALALLACNAALVAGCVSRHRVAKLRRFLPPPRTLRAPDRELPSPPERRVALL